MEQFLDSSNFTNFPLSLEQDTVLNRKNRHYVPRLNKIHKNDGFETVVGKVRGGNLNNINDDRSIPISNNKKVDGNGEC